MNTKDFAELKKHLIECLERRHNTFSIFKTMYVFHDDQVKYDDDTKHGIMINFGLTDIQIKKFVLFGLDKERSRYTDSKELTNDLYHVTVKQKESLLEIVESSVNDINRFY